MIIKLLDSAWRQAQLLHDLGRRCERLSAALTQFANGALIGDTMKHFGEFRDIRFESEHTQYRLHGTLGGDSGNHQKVVLECEIAIVIKNLAGRNLRK